GEYGDSSDRDERFWAAAELFSLTGEVRFLDAFLALYSENFSKTALGYASVGGFGALSFYINKVFSGMLSGGDSDGLLSSISVSETDCAKLEDYLQMQDMLTTRAQIRADFLAAAAHCAALVPKNAYLVAMEKNDYHWGSNMTLLNNGILLILGFLLTGNHKYRKAALSSLHYLLGRNATGYSYVTGHGTISCRYPHMRTVFADGIDEPIPGFVSGGPNAHPSDETGKRRIAPDTPPMKCYLDDYACYSLNEVTIYWNSPAVFVAAFFDSNPQ
ncbi:MAG: glycoside hydrolase family 9 protein, partial [Lachnospiraceae bacterium]|nr:glycoside hydrolase family 9 protein [Lachnospiraceae bacterium]